MAAHASDTAHMVATVQLGWVGSMASPSGSSRAAHPTGSCPDVSDRTAQYLSHYDRIAVATCTVCSVASAMECGEGGLLNRGEMETNVRHDPQPAAQLVRPGCNEEVRRSKSCPDTIIFCGEGTGSSLVRGMGGEIGASSDSSARELISQPPILPVPGVKVPWRSFLPWPFNPACPAPPHRNATWISSLGCRFTHRNHIRVLVTCRTFWNGTFTFHWFVSYHFGTSNGPYHSPS